MEIEPSDNLGIKKIEVGQEVLEIIPLGGGREVGRSCIIIRFREKLIMVSIIKSNLNIARLRNPPSKQRPERTSIF